MAGRLHTYLALGDSYTIGESLPLYESFPYQVVQLLRRNGHAVAAPEIIARTGWTTGELLEAMHNTHFQSSYDMVSLLIGVNNQYRGLPADEYAREFETLLQQALSLADNQARRVVVLSIPDWGITPFAAANGRPVEQVSTDIAHFNQLNRSVTDRYGVHYIDITAGSRLAATDSSLLAGDRLHYSAKEYARWAGLLLKPPSPLKGELGSH